MNAAPLYLASLSADFKADITPGVLGFIVIAGIATALYFLMKSMRRHLSVTRSGTFLAAGDKHED
ncbi:hypothetical protein ACQEU5_12025 [Marinactinospora thermotolerans]|nr:hypothetical protein [Marinactinospora thermotolerans]